MSFLAAVRSLFLSAIVVILLGCAADDPLDFAVTTQETPTADAAGAGDGSNDTQNEVDDDGEVGSSEAAAPTADVFPPVADDISRPREIIDLRGQERVEIVVRGNQFETRFFRVDPGTQLVFVNRGVNPHNVIAAAEGAFPTIPKDALEEAPQVLVLTEPGDYPFYCSIHGTRTRGQTGYVIVGDA